VTLEKLLGDVMNIETEIRKLLEKFWDEQALDAAPDGDISIEDLVPPLDSLAAVEVLVALDKLTGRELPESIIKPGGYQSKNEFVDEISEKVLEFCGSSK
jgi:acyl carrier protein